MNTSNGGRWRTWKSDNVQIGYFEYFYDRVEIEAGTGAPGIGSTWTSLWISPGTSGAGGNGDSSSIGWTRRLAYHGSPMTEATRIEPGGYGVTGGPLIRNSTSYHSSSGAGQFNAVEAPTAGNYPCTNSSCPGTQRYYSWAGGLWNQFSLSNYSDPVTKGGNGGNGGTGGYGAGGVMGSAGRRGQYYDPNYGGTGSTIHDTPHSAQQSGSNTGGTSYRDPRTSPGTGEVISAAYFAVNGHQTSTNKCVGAWGSNGAAGGEGGVGGHGGSGGMGGGFGQAGNITFLANPAHGGHSWNIVYEFPAATGGTGSSGSAAGTYGPYRTCSPNAYTAGAMTGARGPSAGGGGGPGGGGGGGGSLGDGGQPGSKIGGTDYNTTVVSVGVGF